MWKNTAQRYGLVSKSIHWLSALVIFAMFGLGYWMVDLTYYSQWYQTAPHWHESIGILLLLLTIFRLMWRLFTASPSAIASHSKHLQLLSKLGHFVIYSLLVFILITGYRISSAGEASIAVFSWFELASLGDVIENQEDVAGFWHEYLAYGLIGLAILHAFAAIKHHVIDKDETLRRMLK